MLAQRNETLLKDWKFSHSDNEMQANENFNDKKWQSVKVPHDWAIAGPFDKEVDKQVVAIVQNGEKEASERLDARVHCLGLEWDGIARVSRCLWGARMLG